MANICSTKMGTSHCNQKLAAHLLSVFTFLLFIGVLVVNYFAAEGPKGPFKFLHNTTGAISDEFYLEITPAGWTFAIWGFIYLWQLLWLVYSLTLLCRSDAPIVLSPLFFGLYIGSCICNASWLLVFGVELINPALGFLFGIQVTLYATLATVYMRVSQMDGGKLPKSDFVAVQSLVINGIAFYATWVSIASLLNLAMVLTYTFGMRQEDASTIALSILATEIAVWFVLDVAVLSSITGYTLSPYIVLIVALFGSLDKNYVPDKRNSVLTLVLLGVVGALAAIRLAVFVKKVCQTKTEKQK